MNVREIAAELARVREIAMSLVRQIEALEARLARDSVAPRSSRPAGPVPSLQIPAVKDPRSVSPPDTRRSDRAIPTKTAKKD